MRRASKLSTLDMSRRAWLVSAGAVGASVILLRVTHGGTDPTAKPPSAKPPASPAPPQDGCPVVPAGGPPLALGDLPAGPDRARFLAWLRRDGVATDRPVRNLVFNFYDVAKRERSWIYPMLSGKAILWLLASGGVDEAVAIADTVIRWQQFDNAGKAALSYGAFPSIIDPGTEPETYTRGERYYAGDNLVLLEALLALHARTNDRAYLNAAIGIGTWLTDVMCAGHRHGVWAEDHGAPMAFVTRAGDFSNALHTSVELLWVKALERLGRATKEAAYCRQAERAMRFYLRAQAPGGALFDRYDPGYPAKPYDAAGWKQFEGDKLIADNVLRGALGLCRAGELGRARRVFDWLRVDPSGGIPAALDLETGKAKFPAGQEIYYDLSSTALHRSLSQWLGQRSAAERAVALLKSTQEASGAWYWGRLREQQQPVTQQYAAIVGLWATTDLSVPEI